MSDMVLTIIGSIVGVAALAVMVAVAIYLPKIIRSTLANSTSSLAKSAAERGWQFEHSARIGEIKRKWSGTTDGIGWTASLAGYSDNSSDEGYWNYTFRWRSSLENGPSSPLILIHNRSKLEGIDEKLPQLPGFIRNLAAVAIDKVASRYFGPEADEVDLSSWVVVEGHSIPDMRVMAPVSDAQAFRLSRRLASAISKHSAALAAGSQPPVILVRQDAVHLATTSDASDADVVRAVNLGVEIVQALRSI